MKCFFYSNLLEAVMTLDSDNRPGVQVVRDKFCWTGPNDWESENNNINVWPAFWGGYFEWCWMYHPSSQGGTLLLSAVENAKRPQAVALVLSGVNLVEELELMKTCGSRDTPAERPLILYLSPMFEPRQQGGIRGWSASNFDGGHEEAGERDHDLSQ
jgi:hypothetical protein